uniref:Uncharacterized protein n=1 Tax=Anguilla anguilla TaxID=7936 RepID=A0A0E9PJR0_ANGAN
MSRRVMLKESLGCTIYGQKGINLRESECT